MPQQSPTNPRFRCNECKEYHTVPTHISHYQCAVHGYLCSDYTREYHEKECCGVVVKVWEPNIIQWKKRIDYCEKGLIKYIWHKDLGRWIEEGREKEAIAKAKPKKTATKKTDPIAEIREYAKLRDDGLISEEEYETKKKQLLDMNGTALADGSVEIEADMESESEEIESFDVILTSVGPSKINVIKIICNFTGLGLKESKDLTDNIPSVIKTNVTRVDAKVLIAEFEASGARAEIY